MLGRVIRTASFRWKKRNEGQSPLAHRWVCRLRTKKSSTCTSVATARTAASLSSLRSPFTVITTSGRSPFVRLMEHAKPYATRGTTVRSSAGGPCHEKREAPLMLSSVF